MKGAVVVHSIEEALTAGQGAEEIMIIGGGHLYHQILSRVSRLYLTLIEADVGGDTFFPPLDESEWEEKDKAYRPADERNEYAMSFSGLDRKR